MCNTNTNCPSIRTFDWNINNKILFDLFWKGFNVSILNKRFVLIESVFVVVIIDDGRGGGGSIGCSVDIGPVGRFKTEPKI